MYNTSPRYDDKKFTCGLVMQIDTKEFELPETHYIRDIDSSVLQAIVLQCLSQIGGVALLDGGLLDTLLGFDKGQSVRGIFVAQDPKTHSVDIKVEVSVHYGVVMPAKAEEIHTLITHEVTKLTGLHVSAVHVVFKNLIVRTVEEPVLAEKVVEDRYTARFV